VIGHCDGLLAQSGDPADKFRNVAGSIEERVFRMEMKVGKFCHGSLILDAATGRKTPNGAVEISPK
jgi:hypothetical protein